MADESSELLLALKQHLSIQRHDFITAFDEVEELYRNVEGQVLDDPLEENTPSTKERELEARTNQSLERKGKNREVQLRLSSKPLSFLTTSSNHKPNLEHNRFMFTIDDLRRYILTYPWPDHIVVIIRPLLESQTIYHAPNSLLYLQSESFPRQNNFLKAQVLTVRGEQNTMSGHEGPDGVISLWDDLRLDLHRIDDPADASIGQLIEINTSIPVVFAAAHLVFHPLANMDDILDKLHGRDASDVFVDSEVTADQPLRYSTSIHLQYFRVTNDGGDLRAWEQYSAMPESSNEQVVFVSRAAAVIVLWRTRPQPQQVAAQRWKVLSMRSFGGNATELNGDVDESEDFQIVDGYDAFFWALRTQYEAAEQALRAAFKAIRAPTAQPDIIFNERLRDEMMFDDPSFGKFRMNFWSFEALSKMAESITGMINAYDKWVSEDLRLSKLRDDDDMDDPWSAKMKLHQHAMGRRIQMMDGLQGDIYDHRRQVRALRDTLFSTTTMHSRKALEKAAMSAASVHYIRFLTLVNVIFLPMIFVSSVFGMKNFDLPPNDFRPFAITLAFVCVPFWIVLGISYLREAQDVFKLLRFKVGI